MLARRFLWIVTALILVVIAGAFAYRLFSPQLMRAAFVPDVKFEAARGTGPDYARRDMWIARPDLAGSPALWLPPGFVAREKPQASIFFVHPTSYLDRAHWNAPLEDADSQQRARIFVQSQASAFNGVGAIWAPKYRQATVGAFLTDRPDADMALDLAYRDIRAAFEQFMKEAPADQPIILAGHSQGSLLLSRLLAEQVAGTPLARRIAAAYLVGWPLSKTTDLPRLGLPACASAADSGCIVSWSSFGEPADPKQILSIDGGSVVSSSRSRADTPILCVNPLTGNEGDAAKASANLGALIPDASLDTATLMPRAVPARCDSRGLLLIGSNPPDLPPYVLPGNNYHVFDYALFWTNIRVDVERRVAGFQAMITSDLPAFRDALPGRGRLLGLDIGTKTLGVALCDMEWTIASPAELIHRAKFSIDRDRLSTLAASHHTTGIVIGLPLSLDGSDSPRTQSVRAFARNLAPLELPILLWDERWSTQAVTRTLIDADASRARRSALVDKMAAAYILQGAIDALAGPGLQA